MRTETNKWEILENARVVHEGKVSYPDWVLLSYKVFELANKQTDRIKAALNRSYILNENVRPR